MVPAYNPNHVSEALALLTSMFQGRPNIEGLLKSFVGRIQALEDAIWGAINSRQLDGPPGASTPATGGRLDTLGAIVGEARGGRLDDLFREAIRLRILINRAWGTPPQILAILNAAAAGNPWEAWEAYPAGFTVLLSGAGAAYRAIFQAVTQAKGVGIRASAYYTPGALTTLFRPSSSTGLTDAPLARGASHTTLLPVSTLVHVQGS